MGNWDIVICVSGVKVFFFFSPGATTPDGVCILQPSVGL